MHLLHIVTDVTDRLLMSCEKTARAPIYPRTLYIYARGKCVTSVTRLWFSLGLLANFPVTDTRRTRHRASRASRRCTATSSSRTRQSLDMELALRLSRAGIRPQFV